MKAIVSMPKVIGNWWCRRRFCWSHFDVAIIRLLCQCWQIHSKLRQLRATPSCALFIFLFFLCINSNIYFFILIPKILCLLHCICTLTLRLLNIQVYLLMYTLAHFLSLDFHLPALLDATQIFYINIGIDINFLHKLFVRLTSREAYLPITKNSCK